MTVVGLCFAVLANTLSFYIGNDELELRKKVEALEYRLSIAETKQAQQVDIKPDKIHQFKQVEKEKNIKNAIKNKCILIGRIIKDFFICNRPLLIVVIGYLLTVLFVLGVIILAGSATSSRFFF